MRLGGQDSDLLSAGPGGSQQRKDPSKPPGAQDIGASTGMLTSGQEEVRDRHEHALGVRLCWDQGQNSTGGSGLGLEGFSGPLEEQPRPPRSVLVLP